MSPPAHNVIDVFKQTFLRPERPLSGCAIARETGSLLLGMKKCGLSGDGAPFFYSPRNSSRIATVGSGEACNRLEASMGNSSSRWRRSPTEPWMNFRLPTTGRTTTADVRCPNPFR